MSRNSHIQKKHQMADSVVQTKPQKSYKYGMLTFSRQNFKTIRGGQGERGNKR